MPIDPTGTSPHPVEVAPKPKELSLKCRRPGCESITAVEIDIQNPTAHMYRCVKCSMTWTISTGGVSPF